MRQGKINTFDDDKNMFALTLTYIAWNWFEPLMNTIQDMPTLNKKSTKRFNSWGQTLREQFVHTGKT